MPAAIYIARCSLPPVASPFQTYIHIFNEQDPTMPDLVTCISVLRLLPRKVCEGFVGLSHLVRVFASLDCLALIVARSKNLIS